MPVSKTVIMDAVLLAIFLLSVTWGGRRGIAVFFSGILGTGIAAACAYFASPFLQTAFTNLIKPFTQSAVTKVAGDLGLTQALTMPVAESSKGQFLLLLQKLGFTADRQAALFEKAAHAGEKMVSSISWELARQLAPIIAFIALFIFIKLVVFFVIRMLTQSLPVLKSVNRLLGYILGAVSGIVLIVVLCWAGMTLSPESGTGLITQENIRNSVIGALALSPLQLLQLFK